MSSLEKLLSPILYVVRHQKKMLATALIAALVFGTLLFPYGDLSDKITELISKNSQNQVFLQFDDLGIGFFPPSLKMSNVVVEAQFLPTALKAGKLYLAPSIAGLLAFSPGFKANIQDVLKGDIQVSYRAGKKLNDTTRLQKVSLDLSQVDLKDLARFLSLPIAPNGSFSAELDSDLDPVFAEQPDATVQFRIDKFSLPTSTVPTMLGPLVVPSTQLSNLRLKGVLKNGELVIEEGQVGAPGDTIHGRFKGKISLRLSRSGNQVRPEFGGYEFKVDLNLDKASEKNFGVFLGFIDTYKTLTGTGSRYALKVSAPNTLVPPTPGPMGTF